MPEKVQRVFNMTEEDFDRIVKTFVFRKTYPTAAAIYSVTVREWATELFMGSLGRVGRLEASQFLTACFSWTASPQGDGFWRQVNICSYKEATHTVYERSLSFV